MRFFLSALLSLFALAANAAYVYEPSFSADGREIAFVSGGDIWSVPATGGVAHLLVAHPAAEWRPLFSPDGRWLAFSSMRSGNGDVYVLSLADGTLRRLTYDDGEDRLEAWSRDAKFVYYSTNSQDIGGTTDIHRVPVGGGTPVPVSNERYVSEYFSAPSPDGGAVALTARGLTATYWWRHGHSHIDESEIWLRDANGNYSRVSGGDWKDAWPMWSADAQRIFFMSDRDGAENLWSSPRDGKSATEVTHFKDGRLLWPQISLDGKSIVFERDFGIWVADAATGDAKPLQIELRGAASTPGVEHRTLSDHFSNFALSPDGKKVAFVARGDVYAADAKEGGSAARVTRTEGFEWGVNWSPDGRKLCYVSDRDGREQLFLYDFATQQETKLTSAAADDATPFFSPDGKMIAFERNANELRVYDLAAKSDRLLAKGTFERRPFVDDRPLAWSPDNLWIAYFSYGEKLFKNLWVVPAAGGDAKQISFVADTGSNSVSWSPDGKFLLFDTGQRTESGQLARVDLVPHAPKFREDQFRDLFREETPKQSTPPERATEKTAEVQKVEPAAKKTPLRVDIDFENIRTRLSLPPVGVDVGYQQISPDGKWVVMIAAAAGQQNLYVFPLDELSKDAAVSKQITSTEGDKGVAQWTPDSKQVYYLENGKIQYVTIENNAAKPLAVSAETDVDFAREKNEVFHQMWAYLEGNFFDPNFNGVDWTKARDVYAPLVAGSRSPDEMRRIMKLMTGELNASHTDVRNPSDSTKPSSGRVGLRYLPDAGGKLRITEVVPLGPADLTTKIHPGDYLLAVNGQPVDQSVNVDSLFEFTTGKRVVLTIAKSASGEGRIEVPVQPVSRDNEKALLYRAWVEANREYVHRISGGRLGYVHMYDMSSSALAQLYVDLDSENQSRDGIVFDVRNNNGGFVNVYAIDVLSRRSYFQMQPRSMTAAPSRTLLGQRALERPTILVANRQSLSDAEDFTEGYRTLGLGKVVGEPTAGWIIYTSNIPLLDGTIIRLPATLITDHEGKPMEMHPRPVDVPNARAIGEGLRGVDTDLDVAVRELLAQLR